MYDIAFENINWNELPTERTEGSTGFSMSKTKFFGSLRVRMVEYSVNYLADHWCQKGHVVHCLEGSVETQMENGDSIPLTKGMTYVVSDNNSSHRSYSKEGAKLFIVDGDFLK